MEENVEKISIKDVSVKWGLISGIIGIVFSLILMMSDLLLTPGISYVGLIPFGIVLFLAFKEFKDQGDSFMTLGEAVKIGLMISLIGGIMLAIFSYIYGEFIDPGFADKIKENLIEQWETQGMTDEQIEQSLSFMSWMFNPVISIVVILLKNVLVGVVLSLIIGAFTKKSNPELEV